MTDDPAVSASLYFTCLIWAHGHGVAKLHGRQVTLTAAPVVGTEQVHHITYAPEVCLIRVMMWGGPERDMLPGEIDAADRYLRDTCATP